jgi:hypothetical protein
LLDIEAMRTFLDTAFKEAKANNSFMSGYTFSDYFHHINARETKEDLRIWLQPRPDPSEFWDAAFQYDPWCRQSKEGSIRLEELTHPSRFGIIPLGRVYDDAEIGLRPDLTALSESDIDVEDFTTRPFARTNSRAISYPDGHPSHESKYEHPLKPSHDEKLRRFTSLGWVVRKFDDGVWELTGHVLVMDTDHGRDHHPWILLPHQWPHPDNEGIEGDFLVHAPQTVRRNDAGTPDVFPGDRNRTPIAKTTPVDSVKGDNRTILKRFDQDFAFGLLRQGGDRQSVRSEFGPDLVHVMAWYWDERPKEEVCHGRDGSVYMQYDPNQGEYHYPNLEYSSTDGEVGLYGELCTPPRALPHKSGNAPLDLRLDNSSVQEVIPRHCQGISGSGF